MNMSLNKIAFRKIEKKITNALRTFHIMCFKCPYKIKINNRQLVAEIYKQIVF